MDKTETKIVYAYDAVGLYIGDKVLDSTDRSPISGTWQIPANCTETVPLTAKDKYNVVWKGSAWEYQEQVIPEKETPVTTPLTDAEKLMNIRTKRDSLLTACDWTQLADSPLTAEKKQVWVTYRQALRDMPEKGCSDLDNPVWPTAPES
jgi:hypothetical protein